MASPERIEKIDSKYQSSKENLLEKKKEEIEGVVKESLKGQEDLQSEMLYVVENDKVTYNIPAVKFFLEQLAKEGNYSTIVSKGKSAHIMAVQIALEVIDENDGGSDIGKIDGVLGDKTKKGIRDFQVKHGLNGDEKAGKDTIAEILKLSPFSSVSGNAKAKGDGKAVEDDIPPGGDEKAQEEDLLGEGEKKEKEIVSREELVDLSKLNELTSLTLEQVKYIVEKMKNKDLSLNGLTSISKEVATELAKHTGNLYLNGLTSISKEVATELVKHTGNLSLNGLTSISKEVSDELKKHNGNVYYSLSLQEIMSIYVNTPPDGGNDSSNSTSTPPGSSASGKRNEFAIDKHENVNYADIDKLPNREKALLKMLIGRKGQIEGIYDENQSFKALDQSDKRELNKLVRILGQVNFISAMDFLTHCWYDNNVNADTKESFSKSVGEKLKDKNYDYRPEYKDKKIPLQNLAGFYYDFVTTPEEKRQPIHKVMGVLIGGGATGSAINQIVKNQNAVHTVLRGVESSKDDAFMSSVERSLIGMVGDVNLDGEVSAYLGKQGVELMRKWGELSKRERKVQISEGNFKKEYNQKAKKYNKETKEENKSIDRENKTKNIDVAGNISGAQILSAYESAKEIIAVRQPNEKKQEEILVKNLIALITDQSDKVYKSNQGGSKEDLEIFMVGHKLDNITTFEDFSKVLQKRPELMIILKGAINFSHENLTEAFAYGPKWVEHHLDKNRIIESEKKPTATNRSIETARQMDEQEVVKLIGKDLDTKIEKKISEEYAKWLENLEEEVNTEIQRLTEAIKNEKNSTEKEKLEAELWILKNDFKQSMHYLRSEKGMKTMTNKMKIDFVGVMYQHMIPAGTDPSYFLGLGTNASVNIVDKYLKFSLSGGVGVGMQGGKYSGVIGLAVTFSGAADIWKGGTLVYAAGCGASIGTTGFQVGLFASTGLDQRICDGAGKGRINGKATHYLGGIVNASLGLTNGNLFGWGVGMYWRRDKFEGIQNHAAKELDTGYTNLITKLAKSAKEHEKGFSLDAIYEALKKEFPNEKSDLLPFAHDVYAGLAPYAELFTSTKDEDKKALERVITQLAQNFSTHWVNQNVEELKKQGFHVSGVSLGVQFVAGWWPMPTFGIMLTKYKNLHYKESEASKQRSREILEKGYGVDKIEGANFGDFARNLDVILQRRYDNKKVESDQEFLPPKYFEYDELKSLVKIDKSVMEKMNIHIHPTLQQFLSREGNKIIVPAQLPVTYVNKVGAKETTRHLIIGSVGLGNTDFVDSFEKLPVYNETTFMQQMGKLNTLPALSEWAGEIKRNKIDKAYLSNTYNRSLFEGRLRESFGKDPLNKVGEFVDISKLKVSSIGEESFTLQILSLNGKSPVDLQGNSISEITIPYATLGTLKFAKKSENELQISLTPGNTTPDTTPILKVEFGEIKEETKPEKIAFGEALKEQVDGDVLKHFRSWKATEFLVEFRNKHHSVYYECVKNGDFKGAAGLLTGFINSSKRQKEYIQFISNFSTSEKLEGNVNFVYAALSRVLKTGYKQFGENFEGEKGALIVEMKDLAGKIRPNESNSYNKFVELAEERIKKGKENTTSFAEIQKLLGLTATSVAQQPTQPRDKLFWMLADMEAVVDSRGMSFMNRLKHPSELGAKVDAWKELEAARDLQKKKLNFPFDNSLEYGSTPEKGGGYTGLVFAYGKNTGHYKKFINSPLVIKDAIQPLINPDTKRYFLENLKTFQPGANVLSKTMDQINKKLPNSGVTEQRLIDTLCGDGKLHVGERELTIKAEFSFAFFADCVNESLLMGPIEVSGFFTEDVYTSAGDSVPVNEYATLNGAVYTNSANPTLEAGADKINLGLMASVGVEKKPNHGTEPVDGNSKTEAKDLNLSKEDLAKLQKPGVDVEITVGGQKYIVTRTESGTLIASSVGPNSQDFVVRMDGNGNYVIDVPVSPGSGVPVDHDMPPTESARGPNLAPNMVAQTQAQLSAQGSKKNSGKNSK